MDPRGPRRDAGVATLARGVYPWDVRVNENSQGGVAFVRLGDSLEPHEPRSRCEALLDDPGVRCVVLEAAGEKEAEGGAWMVRFPRPLIFVSAEPVPAALAAVALGADIRVGGPGAALTLPTDPSPWVRGRGERLFGSEPPPWGATVAAERLFRLGVVSRLAEDPVAEARRLAAAIAARGPVATELGKEAVWRGIEMPLEQALRFETDLTLLLQTTKDRAEGVRAFLEKRTPRFTGE